MNTHRLHVVAVPVAALLILLTTAGSAATAARGGRVAAAQVAPGLGVTSAAITVGNCTSGTTHWVHLRIADPTIPDKCLGFRGTWHNDGLLPNGGFCGGNNFGTWTGTDSNGNPRSGSFSQGTTYTKFGVVTLNSITIQGWNGNQTCPL